MLVDQLLNDLVLVSKLSVHHLHLLLDHPLSFQLQLSEQVLVELVLSIESFESGLSFRAVFADLHDELSEVLGFFLDLFVL